MDDQPDDNLKNRKASTHQDSDCISRDEVMATSAMAIDETTLQSEDRALMDSEDGKLTADNSSATPLQNPHQVTETSAKSNPETSDLEVTGKYRFQDMDITDNHRTNTTFKYQEYRLHPDPPTPSQTCEETSEPLTAERPQDAQLTEEATSTTKGKEPQNTTCGTDNPSSQVNAPRIGFKHDPAEEAIMAQVEPDPETEIAVGRKKKNKKKRPKSQRGLNAPTGFEPWHADAPITPQEFNDNKKIYDPALPILDRIDEGIKRFLAKRRLEPDRRKVFLKYLQYGGVTVGQNPNQGVTPQELKEMDKEEAMQARANTAIFPNEGKECPISFNDVATGYLTGFYMAYYNPETEEEIKVCTGTMKNFFTYLLYHDVCPEQKEDLEEARKTCDRCEKELWLNLQLVQHDGPGHFNRACSMLFGGYYFDAVDDPETWSHIRYASADVFTREISRKVVKYAIAINGDDRMTRKFKCLVEWDNVEATQIQDIDGFEIISIEYPSEESIAYYRELAPDLLPVGKVKAREFRDPSRGEFDLTPWEKIDWDAGFAPAYNLEFFLEKSVLDLMLPGMKIITNVYATNFGMHFYDEVMAVLPTNYLFLYNDWMIDYKEPKPIDWIGDEQEIERRRAEDMIIEPPEIPEKAWMLRILAKETHKAPRYSQYLNCTHRRHARDIIKVLEYIGFSMGAIREKWGLVEKPKPKPVRIFDGSPVKEESTEKEHGDEPAAGRSVEYEPTGEVEIQGEPIRGPILPVDEDHPQENVN
ncbi:Argonaute complex subunit Arb1 [Penicillium brevicompactum]|uniref:Argonaute complex subunit Arb1 n=1 Tax=Penicillium brevicompactum TaxID=5074 RepID=A0A9W9QN17_PENBR|nr:Argonaute complex subunit Arb1 [Penicillium brevicompactum]